ncbi:hypothetical protein IID20_03515, partial [Patescibacteria group bacterium]|nr:hypothetical protein [Patescibacteria group bacterium]
MARYGKTGTQYFDDAGNPLIAGKLFFMESGSSTDKDTYADVNLTIKNTNPVILTGAGRQPNIFFKGAAKVILTDSDDVQIELRDPDGAQVSSDTFAPWNAFVLYDFNDIVQGSDDRYYASITNGNIGNDPVSTSDLWMEIRFINVWEADYPFQTGYFAVASDDNLYISQIDDNLGNDPTSSPTEWLKVSNTIQNGTANGQILRWVAVSGEYQPTSSVLVNDDGDVGINVEPLAKFHVRTGTDQNLHVIDQGSGGISLRSRTDSNIFD